LHPLQLFTSVVMSTHVPQQVSVGAVQTCAQPPQLLTSVVVSTQAPPQQVLLQGLLHLPQLFGSVSASKHKLPQQTGVVPGQTLLQAPQLFGSLLTSMQVVPQAISGEVQLRVQAPV